MELALIRHTRCDVAAGTCYGHLDVPLANTASADIELTLSRVPPVDLVFSSPSRRCHSLAQALAARDQCEIRVRDELRELNFGSWEGCRWEEIRRNESDAWAADPWKCAPPDGESESQLWQRVARVAEELLQAAEAKRTERAARIAAAPGDIAAAPGDIAATPGDIATAPGDIATASGDIAEASGRMAAPSSDIAAGSGRIAVVSHGGPLRHLRCQLTGTPASDRWSWSIEWGAVALIATRATLIAPRESTCRSSDP